MSDNGVTTISLDPASTIDEVVGNKDGSSVRVTVNSLGQQLLGSGPVADAINVVQDQVLSGLSPASSWSDLLALVPVADDVGSSVPDTDAGTHLQATATGYDGASVPNAGVYRWVADWSRWLRVSPTGLSGKSNVGHGHAVAEVTGLQDELDAKALQSEVDIITAQLNALDAAIVLQGTWDASAGSFPGAGSAQSGHLWIVSVAGTVDGITFGIGDRIVAITDDASETTFAANWFKEDYTPQVLSVNEKTGSVNLTKDDLDLAQVDNTPDAAKPVSTAQQEALDAKAPMDSPEFTGTPSGISSDHLTEGTDQLLMQPAERNVVAGFDRVLSGDVLGGLGRDANGYVSLAILPSGGVKLRRHNEEYIDTGDETDRFVAGVIDEATGYMAFGIRADGTVFVNTDGTQPGAPISPAEISGMAGLNVWAPIRRDVALNRFMSDADSADIAGSGLASYVQRSDIVSDTSVLEKPVWNVVFAYGLSLGLGGSDQDAVAPVYTNAPLHLRQALMLSTGIRGTGKTTAFDASAATDVVGAFETVNGTQSETNASGFMDHLIGLDKAEGREASVYLYHAAGAGGQDIEALGVGTQPYLNLLAALDQIIALAAIYGARVEVMALNWTHGEADTQTDPVLYQAEAETIFAALRAEFDSRDVSPAAGVPVFMDQLSSGSGSPIFRKPNEAFFLIEAADPLAFVSKPKYPLKNVDGVHLQAPGYRVMGEHMAKTMFAYLQGNDMTGCRITDATLTDNTVEVTVNVPVGDLVSDVVSVPPAGDGNLGFLYEDDTGTATIDTVSIGATVLGTCTITVTLDAIPTGANKRISYAYEAAVPLAEPWFGAVGNIRDSDTSISNVPSADAGNGFLQNWLLIQPPIAI